MKTLNLKKIGHSAALIWIAAIVFTFHPPTLKANEDNAANKCGTLALQQVARALDPHADGVNELVGLPAPANGFSLAGLARLSDEYRLGLVAVRRREGSELPPAREFDATEDQKRKSCND